MVWVMCLDAHPNVSELTFFCGTIIKVQGGSYDQPFCGCPYGSDDSIWFVHGIPFEQARTT